MPIPRRAFLAVAGTAAATAGLPPDALAPDALAGTPAGRRHPAGPGPGLTTLSETLRPGRVLRTGRGRDYRAVAPGGGEPHVVRAELARPRPGRPGRRRSLVSFVHLTDQHVVDAQSPARVEFLDRYADGECGRVPLFSSAFRAHEAASARIGDAMLRQVRAVGVSPVSGAPLQAAICTGDNTDNRQGNELATFLELMDGSALTGRALTAQSGAPTRYEGVQRSGDQAYWHPDPGITAEPDRYKTLFGFPDAPGWLEEALAPFEAAGAGMPWLSCYGNHDGLAQGNSPVLPAFRVLVEGGAKVVGTPEHATCQSFTDPRAALGRLTEPGAPAMPVTPDPDRQYVDKRAWMRAHLDSPGTPRGHGFSGRNVDGNVAYYVRDVGQVRWVVLDTVNPGGLNSGSVGQRQLDWLDDRLAEADAQRRPVLLFSHHGPRSLDNPNQAPDPLAGPDGNDLPRRNADAVLAVVAAHPVVIGWVDGHTHENVVRPQDGRFWDIGTAAHIDWPSQARLIEVLDNRDGTLSLFTTMVDHADDDIASFARELMANDPQKGFGTGTGAGTDRNTELLLAHPFPDG